MDNTATRPNVIFILSDDQGPWAAGCYGNPEIRTPNIDRLAATGVRLTDFFCTSPVCSPARASLMTGAIPSRHGVHDWLREGNIPPNAIEYLQGQTTYTDVLAAHGYRCGISGKWHLGASQLPQHGFNHWFVHQLGGGPYHNAPMIRDGQLYTEPGYVTNVITEDALQYLDAQAGRAQPFYLSVHYTAPHSPWTGHPQDLVDSYDDCPFESCPQEPRHPWAVWLTDENLGNRESLKGYFAAVTAMDADVGRIIDRVEALGLRENTLIVFGGDNGFSAGHHGFWGKGNGTLPFNMYDNSVKVPMVFSHPGRLPQGLVCAALANGYDFAPTLLDYLDLPGLPAEGLPGRSFVPALLGNGDGGHESVVVFSEYGPVRMIRTRQWKYVCRHPAGPDELYHLATDPGERHNLVEAPEHAATLADLKAEMEAWFIRHLQPDRDGRDLPVTGEGQLHAVGHGQPVKDAFAR